MLKCINVMELMVDSNLLEVMQQEGCCTCERCVMDARALILNKIPPKYVVTDAGQAFEECRQTAVQNRVSLYQCMLESVHKVKESPHHDDKAAFNYY